MILDMVLFDRRLCGSVAGSFDPVFKFTALLYLLGTAVWNRFCTGEVVFS